MKTLFLFFSFIIMLNKPILDEPKLTVNQQVTEQHLTQDFKVVSLKKDTISAPRQGGTSDKKATTGFWLILSSDLVVPLLAILSPIGAVVVASLMLISGLFLCIFALAQNRWLNKKKKILAFAGLIIVLIVIVLALVLLTGSGV